MKIALQLLKLKEMASALFRPDSMARISHDGSTAANDSALTPLTELTPIPNKLTSVVPFTANSAVKAEPKVVNSPSNYKNLLKNIENAAQGEDKAHAIFELLTHMHEDRKEFFDVWCVQKCPELYESLLTNNPLVDLATDPKTGKFYYPRLKEKDITSSNDPGEANKAWKTVLLKITATSMSCAYNEKYGFEKH